MLPSGDPAQNKRPTQKGWKVKAYKQIFQANGQEKKAEVTILTLDKIDFKKRAIKRDP